MAVGLVEMVCMDGFGYPIEYCYLHAIRSAVGYFSRTKWAIEIYFRDKRVICGYMPGHNRFEYCILIWIYIHVFSSLFALLFSHCSDHALPPSPSFNFNCLRKYVRDINLNRIIFQTGIWQLQPMSLISISITSRCPIC